MPFSVPPISHSLPPSFITTQAKAMGEKNRKNPPSFSKVNFPPPSNLFWQSKRNAISVKKAADYFARNEKVISSFFKGYCYYWCSGTRWLDFF